MHILTCYGRFLLLLIFGCGCLVSYVCAPVCADEPKGLRYTVDLSDAKNHYVVVELTTIADRAETELMMAVWTPGSYLVREFARHLDSLKVTDAAGNELAVEKTRKNRWKVKTQPGEQFKVAYRLYCNEVSVRTNFVEHRLAVLNGAPTFLTIPAQMNQPHQVQLNMPTGWQKSASSMSAGDVANTYVAANFDELVDSPIVAGLVDVYPFDVAGVPHQLVNVGESGYWDGAAAAADLKKIVQQHQTMWGVVPYDRYLFINVIAEGRGGLEHDHCNLMLASRWAYRVPEKYQDWLSLASHEFFHTWNIRRLRPTPLMKYDYENEVYTDSLWIAEGITSYYEDIALVRSGLIDRKEFLKRLSKNIEKVQPANGRKVQSLRDASFDSWIKFYRPDENSSNTRVSYYSKGAIVAFLLDAEIRNRTANQKCLDDVMRAMYKNFLDTGYTQANFRNTASEIVGADLTPWFEHTIDSTQELDYQPAIDWLGMEFGKGDEEITKLETAVDEMIAAMKEIVATDKKDEAQKKKVEEPDAKTNADDEEAKKERWIGVKLEGQTVVKIAADSPATDAGINWKDSIVGINGFQIHESLEKHLKQFEIGDKIDLLVSRKGELMTLTTTIALKPEAKWSLQEVKKPTQQQVANIDLWLQDHKDQPAADKHAPK